MDALKVYQGGHRNVAVYDTYADGGRIHFDVFLPTDRRSVTELPADMDTQALAVAQKFLAAMGKPGDVVQITRCRRCHIDDTDLYAGQLWELQDALIWPLEGCPRPRR